MQRRHFKNEIDSEHQKADPSLGLNIDLLLSCITDTKLICSRSRERETAFDFTQLMQQRTLQLAVGLRFPTLLLRSRYMLADIRGYTFKETSRELV